LLNVGEIRNAQAQGSLYLSNSGNLVVDDVTAGDAVSIQTAGSLTTNGAQACDCEVSISGASVNLIASGLVDIVAGSTVTATNGVSVYAGFNPASNTYTASNNTLGIEGSVSGSTVTLAAGGAINVTGTVTGTLTELPNQYSQPVTLEQCIANPSLAGCSALLPTLAQCESAPTTPGCSAELPELFVCEALPSTPGCKAVLPTVAECTATPRVAGCSAVLPTLAQCSASPSEPGCSVVLNGPLETATAIVGGGLVSDITAIVNESVSASLAPAASSGSPPTIAVTTPPDPNKPVAH
jgi:hypothetical protein